MNDALGRGAGVYEQWPSGERQITTHINEIVVFSLMLYLNYKII